MFKHLKALATWMALAAVLAFLAPPAGTMAAPKHLGAITLVAQAAPKHLAATPTPTVLGRKWAPRLASTVKEKKCTARDGGYRVIVDVEYTTAGGKVDVLEIYTQYEHRLFGLWQVEDWATGATDTIVNAGITWGSWSRNPAAKNVWLPQSPDFRVNGLKAGIVDAAGKGNGKSLAACLVALP